MKWKLIISILLVGFLFNCKNRTEISLQKEEKSISVEPKEFEFSEIASGTIHFEYYIESGFMGELVLQNQDEIVFEYQINTNIKLYPINNKIAKWQQISVSWNLESSSLSVFINEQLQTTRLVNSENNTSINKLIIKPRKSDSKNKIRIRNVTYTGENYQLSERLKIVAFGNSTTAFRNTITGVYSQRLPELLLEEGIPNVVFNEGVGGSHTGHLSDNNRHRVKHALDRLESHVLVHQPDITIICFGINDSWFDGNNDKPRIPIFEFEKNLKYIMDTLQKAGSQIILMTPNALGERHEKWRYDNTEKYVEIIRKLAVENEIALIDQWQIFEEYVISGKDIDGFLLDGTHPNDKWHEELAELLAEKIKSITK